MLLPVVLIITLLAARGRDKGGPAQKKVALLPGFLIAFVVLAALNGFALVAKPIASVLTEASKWLLVISVAALGMKTSLREMMAVGTTAIALIAAETIFLALLVLGWITLMGRRALTAGIHDNATANSAFEKSGGVVNDLRQAGFLG
jgi:uncharacterized membrane protein YadS